MSKYEAAGPLRSRLVYLQPDQATYEALVAEADLDMRPIRAEAIILIREALAARMAARIVAKPPI